MSERKFPLQVRDVKPEIDWEIAKLAYTDYASRFGTDQSLARLAKRGGFGVFELIDYLVGLIKTQGKLIHELRRK